MGNDTMLTTQVYRRNEITATSLNRNKVILFYDYNIYDQNGYNEKIGRMFLAINNTEITISSRRELYGSKLDYRDWSGSIVKLADENVFLMHNCAVDNRLASLFLKIIEGLKQLEEISDKIFGIAKTSGQAGEFVKVITPKYLNESEEN